MLRKHKQICNLKYLKRVSDKTRHFKDVLLVFRWFLTLFLSFMYPFLKIIFSQQFQKFSQHSTAQHSAAQTQHSTAQYVQPWLERPYPVPFVKFYALCCKKLYPQEYHKDFPSTWVLFTFFSILLHFSLPFLIKNILPFMVYLGRYMLIFTSECVSVCLSVCLQKCSPIFSYLVICK